ncbi:MAG: hypothetical protein Hals2KO_15940 [Halioglobus sp.]
MPEVANPPVENVLPELGEVDVVNTLMGQINGYIDGFVRSLPNIAVAIVVVLATWGLVKLTQRLIRKGLSRTRIRRALIDLMVTLSSILIWGLGFLVTMTVLFPSVKPSSILAALGVGGIAVGFAFKDIFENFMAGAMIMLRKPMRIGDFIACEGVEGKIEEIMIRDTYVRQTDGQLVLVPNSMLFKNPVFVRTDKDIRRFDATVGVAYDVDIEQARKVIEGAITGLERVQSDKPVEIYVCEFNSSSVDFNVRWWAQSAPIDMHQSRDAVLSAVKQALDEAGIEIPFPYRTLTFKEPLPLAQPQQSEPGSDGDA